MAVDDSEIPDPFSLAVAMIVGPYFGDGSYEVIDGNIDRARAFAIALANLHIGFFCAHTHTAHFEVLAGAPESFYLALDLRFLSLAHCAIFTPGWQQSNGSLREHRLAKEWGLPCFYPASPDDLNEVQAWISSHPTGTMPSIIGLLVEVEQWVRDLCSRYNLRGWNRSDSLMLDRIADVAALRLTGSHQTLQVLARLLAEVSSWAGDFLAWAQASETKVGHRRNAVQLDLALVRAHQQVRTSLAA